MYKNTDQSRKTSKENAKKSSKRLEVIGEIRNSKQGLKMSKNRNILEKNSWKHLDINIFNKIPVLKISY